MAARLAADGGVALLCAALAAVRHAAGVLADPIPTAGARDDLDRCRRKYCNLADPIQSNACCHTNGEVCSPNCQIFAGAECCEDVSTTNRPNDSSDLGGGSVMMLAEIALGAALVLAVVALAGVIWRAYSRRGELRASGRRGGRRAPDAASLTSEQLFVSQLMRDRPPRYDDMPCDKPPSYNNLEGLQEGATSESGGPRSPGIRNRQSSNATIASNPPAYDTVFTISQHVEQNVSAPAWEEVQGAAAREIERETTRVQWAAGDDSQDEEETMETPAKSCTNRASTCKEPENATGEFSGYTNLAFSLDEKDSSGTRASSEQD